MPEIQMRSNILLVTSKHEEAAEIRARLAGDPTIDEIAPGAVVDATVAGGQYGCVVIAGAEGALEQVRVIRAVSPFLPIVIAGEGVDVAFAVRAVRCGATECVPADRLDTLPQTVGAAIEDARSRAADPGERFRAIIEQGSELVAILDANGVALYESPSVCTILGYSAAELVGRSQFDLVHPDDRPAVEEIFRKEVRERGTTSAVEVRLQHADGSWRWFESIRRSFLDDPVIGGVVVTSRDITERKLVQEQLANTERITAISRLAATIAHEFNNVLMGIQPFVDVIRRFGGDNAKITEATSMISTSIARGRRITQDILRFTRPAGPALQTIDTPQWLAATVREVARMAGPSYSIEVSGTSPAMAGDSAQLTQVLTNVLLNARDAMPAGGTIHVLQTELRAGHVFPFGVVPEGNYAYISVEDAGSGIRREHLPLIFEPLFTTKKNGTGFGLAVAHQIVKSHHGYLFAESAPGSGTTIHLFIPTAGQLAVQPPQEPAADGESRPLRVLLIEDDETVATGIAAVLALAEHEIVTARSAREALAILRRSTTSFDCAILDVNLPDMSGLDLFREIRALDERQPVVFSTAHHEPAALQDLIGQHERVAFLMKPYEVHTLIHELRRITAR